MIQGLLDALAAIADKVLRKLFKRPPRFLDSREKVGEIVSYLIFGFLTTLVSLVAYFIPAHILNNAAYAGGDLQWRANVCQVLSWVMAVLFAFFTNKKYVFHSTEKAAGALSEFFRFVLARLVSFLLIEIGIFNILLLVIHSDSVCKLIVTVLVIVFNYLASKLAVFRPKNEV